MTTESHSQDRSFKHRIILVVCYFGRLPPYSSLVFHSVAHNASIDWLIIGDQPPDYPLPPNVSFVPSTLQEIEREIERTCETRTVIKHAYDLARLKPTFGLCFKKYLEGYDFWGHVDLDMIYGDLRAFLPEAILESHDRIYCRGHLSLFRNNPEVNRYFMLEAPGAPYYKDVLANISRVPFDEWDGIWKIFRYHRIKQYHAEVIADIRAPSTYKVRRFEATELKNHTHQVFYWHQGKTYQAYYHWEGGLFDHEIAYIHFQKRKLPKPAFAPAEVRGFTIGPDGFAPYDRENLTREEMNVLNPTRWKPLEEIRQILMNKLWKKIRPSEAKAAPHG